jgi:uncharacterized protein YggT (Ycf19 family)
MDLLLVNILSFLVGNLPLVLFVGWIVGMADPGGRWAVTRALNTISMPFFNLVGGVIPRIGALDISPILIVVLSMIVNRLLWQLV